MSLSTCCIKVQMENIPDFADLGDVLQLVDREENKKEKAICEESLLEFVSYVWPVIEPSIPFIRGWAIKAICEHLQAVTEGKIRRLLINVPPGFSKSTITSVCWPAWEWGPKNRPSTRFICASYSCLLYTSPSPRDS